MENSNEEVEKKTTSKGLYITKIVVNVIFYILIFMIFLGSIANIKAGKSSDGFPNIFGRGYLAVASDSMEGDFKNSFNAGDMAVVNVIGNNKQEVANKLKVGDIITFYDPTNLRGKTKQLNTHRVVYLWDADNDGNVDAIYTMGDKFAKLQGFDTYETFSMRFKDAFDGKSETNSSKATVNNWLDSGDLQDVSIDNLRGTYMHNIANGGSFSETLAKWGLIIIVLPLVIFLGIQIFIFVKTLLAYKKAKYNDTHKEEIESKKKLEREKLKEQLRRELLEEMNNEKEFSAQQENDEKQLSDEEKDVK